MNQFEEKLRRLFCTDKREYVIPKQQYMDIWNKILLPYLQQDTKTISEKIQRKQ
ncbi:hypothetical protein MGH68_17865 [Erysipelothrix sp. D19-032]